MLYFQADVALVTAQPYLAEVASSEDWYLGNILRDDQLLQTALSDHGLSSSRVNWADPTIDWSKFGCVVFRTPWDYFDRLAEFTAWLQQLTKQTRLCNEHATIEWNMDKHYLADLAAQGIPVVPSHFIEQGGVFSLPDLLDTFQLNEAVIKPCISGGARHTYRVNRLNSEDIGSTLQPLLRHESFILQPFQTDILHSGEDTLMIFDGHYSHAVRKRPKPDDFRVQDDHGGSVHPYQPTPQQIELAERTIAACQQPPAYGRVDLVRDNQGHNTVMELELIEPELWLRYHLPAATSFATAIAARM